MFYALLFLLIIIKQLTAKQFRVCINRNKNKLYLYITETKAGPKMVSMFQNKTLIQWHCKGILVKSIVVRVKRLRCGVFMNLT